MRSPSVARGLALLAMASAASWVGCGGGSDLSGPPVGSLDVSIATSGPEPDTDGYTVSIDGGVAQPIAVNATRHTEGVAEGPHTVELGGLAGNCAPTGGASVSVEVDASAATAVRFDVACSATTGTIEVATTSTGSPPDSDGYQIQLDGTVAQPIGTGATVTLPGVAPGNHTVLLGGLAANCKTQGANPRAVTVAAGDTVTAAFAVTCTATTGALAVTVSGLPAGTNAAVTITGPGGFSQPVTATTTLADLSPASYTVTAAAVTSGGTQYTPSPATSTVSVTAGSTASATVTYAAAAGPSLNLRIDGMSLSQSVQSEAGDVPLVANRAGFLRVFVVADQPNTAKPSVRVRLYRDGAPVQTIEIRAPGSSTPLRRDEPTLTSSWNVEIPRDLFGPGLAVLADVDPAGAIAEKDEADNSYPASGTPLPETVRSVPELGVTFVPVRQQVSGLTGDVSAANKARFLDLVRRMYPVSTADGDVHQVYTTTTADRLVSDDANRGWETILDEIYALRVAEGATRNYYGVVRIDYGSGIAGLGYVGAPAAIGYDRADDRSRVMAHEMGHNFGRQHSPCGQPSGVDPSYPYADGLTGAYGYDLQDDVLKSPLLADIMGYCSNPWISDYTYEGILAFRTGDQAALTAAASAAPERCLLVWGRIVDGRAVLEPAFEIVTRPSLPKRRGPYSVEAVGRDGSRLFSLSFDASEVQDGRREARQFAFAVPLGGVTADRVGELRLGGPAGQAVTARAPAAPRAEAIAPAVEARRVAGGVALRWDAAAHPMLMVRDPDTGEIVSFARGGTASVATSKSTLDLVMSDGVGSRGVRVTARQ